MKRLLLSIVFLLVAFNSIFANGMESSKADDKTVLVVSSYSSSYIWSNEVIEKVSETLNRQKNVSAYTYHLAMIGIDTVEQLDSLAENIHASYDKAPDLVILIGSNSYVLMPNFGGFWPQVPILAIGGFDHIGPREKVVRRLPYNKSEAIPMSDLRKHFNMTHIGQGLFVKETVQLIDQLMPDVQNLYFIGGEDVFSKGCSYMVKEAVKNDHSNMVFHSITSGEITTDSLVHLVGSLDARRDAVLYSSWLNHILYRDRPVEMNSVIRILSASNAPIFMLREQGMVKEPNNSIVGGCFVDDDDFYAHLDNTLTTILEGKQPKDIPFYMNRKGVYKIDYTGLEHFGIDPKLCPSETVYYNAPLSFWAQHSRSIIIICASVLLLFIILLVSLLVSERKRRINGAFFAKQLIAAKEKAEESNRLKSVFLANMSHEIRTPLNAISGFSSMLCDTDISLYSPEERTEMVGVIKTNVHLLTTLVKDILMVSKLESGKYQMQYALNTINDICRNSLASVRDRCPESVTVSFESSFPDHAELYTDVARLQEVLINFLTNAEKYTSEGSIILRVDTATPEQLALLPVLPEGKACSEAVVFSVTDTGQGIPPQFCEKIFDRFEKLDSFKQGTGLGLNICKLIAEGLNAHVRLDTSYRSGARFEFIHPVDARLLSLH